MFRSKRIATLSVAALAALLVFASTSPVAVAATSADRLPALIKETSAQFQLAYRMHPNEVRLRQEQLDAAVAAWRAAPRSAANDERLANWMRSAIRASMPGQREALPTVPDFKSADKPVEKSVEKVEKRPVETAPSEPTPARPTNVSVPTAESTTTETATTAPKPTIEAPAAADEHTDPFRDDPIEELEQN